MTAAACSPAGKTQPGRSTWTRKGACPPCIYLNLPVDAPASSPEAVNRRVFGSAVEEDPLGIWQSGPFRMFRDALQSPLPDIPCRTCPKRFETGN